VVTSDLRFIQGCSRKLLVLHLCFSHVIIPRIKIFLDFWRYWGLNSGPHTVHQPIFFVLGVSFEIGSRDLSHLCFPSSWDYMFSTLLVNACYA
jgi:hypothetical protein